jgi:type I restriction enzyme S subunit
VEELDCLSGVIDKKREQLRELDALAQSSFYQMFGDPITNEKGWEGKKIKEVFSVKIGPFGSLLHNSDYISGGTPLVNPIHMHNERICPDFDFSVSDDKLKELRNYILRTNDIVLARRGDIGRCAIVGVNEDGYLCGTGSLFMRPTTDINSNFIIKQIRCNSMIEYLTSLAKGATMLNINCKIVEELNFILPPISLQQEFADKIEAIEKQKELIKQSIAETETLFNARMDYYFI